MRWTPQWRYAADGTMLVLIPSARARRRGRLAMVFRVSDGLPPERLARLNRVAAVSGAVTRGSRMPLTVVVALAAVAIAGPRVEGLLELLAVVAGAIVVAIGVGAVVRLVVAGMQMVHARAQGVPMTQGARVVTGAIGDLTARDRDLLTRDALSSDITDEVRSRRRWEATPRPAGTGAREHPRYGLPRPPAARDAQ